MQDVTISQLTTELVTWSGIDREDAETLVRYAVTEVGANLPTGAVAVTESVAAAVSAYLVSAELDPAAAVEMVMDRVEPEDHEDLTPAAIRDYCRRVAFTRGATDRKVSAAYLPAIADEVATIIKKEAAAREAAQHQAGHVAGMDVLAALRTGWTMEYNARDFRHRSGASFTISQDDETVRVHYCRAVESVVETFSLDRPSTTAARLAAIITAATI